MLQFETDEAGVVISGRVVDASSGWGEWEELAKEVVTLTQGKPLRRASGGRGVVVTLDVTSAVKNVDGVTQTDQHGVLDTVGAIAGTIMNPIGATAAHSAPALRVVSVHIQDVRGR